MTVDKSTVEKVRTGLLKNTFPYLEIPKIRSSGSTKIKLHLFIIRMLGLPLKKKVQKYTDSYNINDKLPCCYEILSSSCNFYLK